MDRTKVLQELRKMRFEHIYQQRTERRLTMEDAAELLNISERTFRRWCRKYEEEGEKGLEDKRIGKKANNAAPVDELLSMLTLYETRFHDFAASHFYDIWQEQYGGTRCYTWVKKSLQEAGLIKKVKKRGAHRKKRPRRPMIGMMLHQDGSTHQWIEGIEWDLIITFDDATNEIYSAFFVEEEGTLSSFRGAKEVIETHGLFCSIYTDRGSHYWFTPKAGGEVDKNQITQFQRAMNQLGIEMIPAYSPEARGRCERAFKTIQGRLPKELKLADICDMEPANKYLKEIFIPSFNKRFTVKPQEKESAFVPWLNHIYPDEILCIQEQRTVGKDNTVSYQNKKLQIPKDKIRYNYVKAKVRVHEYLNNSLAIFYGPRCLARYASDGNLFITQQDTLKTLAG